MPALTEPVTTSPAEPDPIAPRRRRAIIAGALVAALVAGSVAWGVTTALEAAAAEEQREALRLADLDLLLGDRSQARELLAISSTVIATVTESGVDFAALAAAHDELADELARPLDRETAHRSIIVQSRLLASDRSRLMTGLDDQARLVISEARDARSAAPLATAATLATLDQAVAVLGAVRQGLPSSYSGRAALIAAVVDARNTVTESHAVEKAEQERLEAERLEAERRAAEEAARRSARSGTPVTIAPIAPTLPECFEVTDGLWCRGDWVP